MKFWLEVVQDSDGTYSANMLKGGTPVTGLPSHVDYNTLKDAIRVKTGIEILKRNRMLFQQEGHKKYAYIDATQERQDCRVTLDEVRHGWKPDFSLSPFDKEAPTISGFEDILRSDDQFRYMMLDRMRSDCEYYFGNGNRNCKHLWAGSEVEQIACMKALWKSFNEDAKPEWLPYDKILEYERQMGPKAILVERDYKGSYERFALTPEEFRKEYGQYMDARNTPGIAWDSVTVQPMVHIGYCVAFAGTDSWNWFFTDMAQDLPQSDIASGNLASVREDMMQSLKRYLPKQKSPSLDSMISSASVRVSSDALSEKGRGKSMPHEHDI